MTRAERRQQKQRAKQRARRNLLLNGVPDTPRLVGIHARSSVTCSCWMCGNKRQYWGAPVSEVRRIERVAP